MARLSDGESRAARAMFGALGADGGESQPPAQGALVERDELADERDALRAALRRSHPGADGIRAIDGRLLADIWRPEQYGARAR